jgi:hypothetical protein
MPPGAASARETAALAALGLVSVAEAGLRVAAAPARTVWHSRLARPARAFTAPAVDGLVRRGQREQLRLRAATQGGVTELAVGVVVDHAIVERAVAELLRGGVIEDVAEQVATSRLPAHLEDSPALAQLVDEMIDRLLASEQLQRVVAHIARSQEVRDALTAQPATLATELAGEMRARTALADDTAERVARRLLRRRSARPDRVATDPG